MRTRVCLYHCGPLIENTVRPRGALVHCEHGVPGVHRHPNVVLTENLFWSNTPADVDDPLGCFPDWQSKNLFADPLFCDPTNDDYYARNDSPALSDTLVIGAFAEPGCSS